MVTSIWHDPAVETNFTGNCLEVLKWTYYTSSFNTIIVEEAHIKYDYKRSAQAQGFFFPTLFDLYDVREKGYS